MRWNNILISPIAINKVKGEDRCGGTERSRWLCWYERWEKSVTNRTKER